MKALLVAVATSALLAGAALPASAQPDFRGDHGDRGNHNGWANHGDQRGNGWGRDYNGGDHHWRRGERMGRNDWDGASRVDYRRHHLRAPPRGYEWRESHGQYVLGAVATGLIASIILNNGR